MKKTPLHNLIDNYQKQVEALEFDLENQSDTESRLFIKDEIRIKKIFIEDLQSQLPIEKEIIIDAWHNGYDRPKNTTGHKYYSLHFKHEKSSDSGYELYTLAG